MTLQEKLNKKYSSREASSFASTINSKYAPAVQSMRARLEEMERKKKEEMIQQGQQDAINYAQEAYKGKGLIGGALSWINRVTGRGTAMPTLVNETPEYTEQRKSSEAEVNKGFGTRFKEATIGSATESAYDIFFQKKVDDVNLKVIEENNKRLADLVKKNKAETDNGRKAIRDKAIKNVVDLNKNLASEVGGELKDKDFLQLVGQSIGTALDLTPFLGFSTFGTQAVKFVGKNLLKQGVKTFTKESIKQIAKESAKLSSKQVLKHGVAEAGLYGAMSGLGGGLEQKDRTVGSVVKSTVIGGGIGAGLGLGVGLLGKYAGKLFTKRATKEAEEILTNNIEKKLGKLDPDESSIIKEAIKDGASEVDIVKQIKDARDLISGPKTPKVEATKAEKPTSKYLYHTTTKENIEGIKKNGLKMSKANGDEPAGVYGGTERWAKSFVREGKENVALVLDREKLEKLPGYTPRGDSEFTFPRDLTPEEIDSVLVKIEPVKSQPLQEGVKVKTEKVEVPKSQLPVGEGKTKQSRLEARIKNSLENAPDEVKNNISTYGEMHRPDQISKATKYVLENPDEAMEVLKGNKPAPDGLLHNSVFVAMSNQAKGDGELARKLATLRSTRYGQEINILQEMDVHNPVKYLKDLVRRKIEIFGGEDKVVKYVRENIKRAKKTTNANYLKSTDWSTFVDSIKCK